MSVVCKSPALPSPARAGFAELCQLNEAFKPFSKTLFRPDRVGLERDQQNRAANEKLEQSLASFLALLSPHFMSEAATQVLEFLIRQYRQAPPQPPPAPDVLAAAHGQPSCLWGLHTPVAHGLSVCQVLTRLEAVNLVSGSCCMHCGPDRLVACLGSAQGQRAERGRADGVRVALPRLAALRAPRAGGALGGRMGLPGAHAAVGGPPAPGGPRPALLHGRRAAGAGVRRGAPAGGRRRRERLRGLDVVLRRRGLRGPGGQAPGAP